MKRASENKGVVIDNTDRDVPEKYCKHCDCYMQWGDHYRQVIDKDAPVKYRGWYCPKCGRYSCRD
jgi:hypothetical protein